MTFFFFLRSITKRVFYDHYCLYSLSEVILKLSQSAREQFLTLIEVGNYLRAWTYLRVWFMFCRKLQNWWKRRQNIETPDLTEYTRWELDYDLTTYPVHGLFYEYLEMGKNLLAPSGGEKKGSSEKIRVLLSRTCDLLIISSNLPVNCERDP